VYLLAGDGVLQEILIGQKLKGTVGSYKIKPKQEHFLF